MTYCVKRFSLSAGRWIVEKRGIPTMGKALAIKRRMRVLTPNNIYQVAEEQD